MSKDKQFSIVFMDEATEFVNSLPLSARVKGGFSNNELFKKLDGSSDFWEFRTLYNGMQYRLLAFWDVQENRMVIATHGFVKKRGKSLQKKSSEQSCYERSITKPNSMKYETDHIGRIGKPRPRADRNTEARRI